MSLIKREPSPAQSEASRSNTSSVSWRHYVHETLKMDIKNEAASSLKTKAMEF